MSRLRRIANYDRLFFVTTNLVSTVHPLDAEERDIVVEQLTLQRVEGEFLLFAYVVMPTHMHVLLAPTDTGLVGVIRRLKRMTALRIGKHRKQQRPLWQPRYFDFVLRRAGDFWDKLEYIHENPIAANLVDHAADWQWSSAAEYSGHVRDWQRIDRIDLPVDRKTPLQRSPRH